MDSTLLIAIIIVIVTIIVIPVLVFALMTYQKLKKLESAANNNEVMVSLIMLT